MESLKSLGSQKPTYTNLFATVQALDIQIPTSEKDDSLQFFSFADYFEKSFTQCQGG